ncbi:unnamed protein product [Strongylus vulgaris]|uniref:Uncharacterized protein n=1 Tax=Strongylus vulgaris TaxID=40348 RepID=A0A3P7JXZ3_STRVU|nr:unnamed protein product [Strongylus vulgaris]
MKQRKREWKEGWRRAGIGCNNHKFYAIAVGKYSNKQELIAIIGSGQWAVEDNGTIFHVQEHYCPCDSKAEKSAAIVFGWMKSVVDSVTDTAKSLAVEETTQDKEDITRPRVIRKTNLSPLEASFMFDFYNYTPPFYPENHMGNGHQPGARNLI